MKFILQLLLLSVMIFLSLQHENLTFPMEWKYIDYDWIDDDQRIDYIDNGLYVKNASFIADTIITNDRVFVSIPRSAGVPASFGVVNLEKKVNGSYLITPYPDWSWSNISNPCDKVIVSVYRMDIDKCGRVWVMDNGKNEDDVVCSPKLIVFDPDTDEVVLQKEIPSEYATNSNGTGLLVTPVVATYSKNCDKAVVYMADSDGYGLVIWRGKDKFQRFESPYFDPYPSNSEIKYDGITGLAFYKSRPDVNCKTFFCHRLYFSALNSYKMYHVLDSSLKSNTNETLDITEDNGDINLHKVPLVIEDDFMYFVTVEDYSLRKWNISTEYTLENTEIIKTSEDELDFVFGLHVANNESSNCLEVYGVSNKYQKTVTMTRDTEETNFVIFCYSLCEEDESD